MIKEFVKGRPYFIQSGKIQQFPYLDEDIECDVLIIGGGIDGAIAAYYFSQTNLKVVVIDKGAFGRCSTCVATALLEYQLDDHADELKKYLTKDEIIAAYNLGLTGIKEIEKFITKYGNECNFSKRPTLIYTQNKSEIKEIEREYKFRQDNKLTSKLISKKNNSFNFEVECGILCDNGGAEFNPYLFTKQLIEAASKNEVIFYENTNAKQIIFEGIKNKVITNYENTITCKKIIIATGYNTEKFTNKKLCDLYTSYTVVTSQIEDFNWHKNALLHDNTSPYHYIRLSHDNRIIIGGEDKKLHDDINLKDAQDKYRLLHNHIDYLFPQIKNRYVIDYEFCGAFGTTKNNLGIIGASRENENLWFFLGYGANGIVNCMYAAQMLVDLYYAKVNKWLYLFSPDRKLT